MNPEDKDSVLTEVIRSIEREIKAMREDASAAAMEWDDHAEEVEASQNSTNSALETVAGRLTELKRSHAALCRRVDKIQFGE